MSTSNIQAIRLVTSAATSAKYVGFCAKDGDSFLATIGGSFANHMARNWQISCRFGFDRKRKITTRLK